MKITFTKLDPRGYIPTQGNPSDAGYDMRCMESFALVPGERKLIKTGIAAAIPRGYYGRLAPRSGLAYKHGIDILAGVVDSGYRGDIGIVIINLGQEEKTFEAGDKIAQYIITPCVSGVERLEVSDLEQAERGTGGFGSTGNK